MKARFIGALLFSHLGIAWLGGWLSSSSQGELAPPAAPGHAERHQQRAQRPAAPASPNPILRASGGDFRAAWDQMIVGARDEMGEPHENSINLFIDWCRVDPDGAVQGLGRLYAPRFVHNYLGNAINHHGALLAPALARHRGELRLLPDYRVLEAFGRSLNVLAKEDPETAAALVAAEPPAVRDSLYASLFERLDIASIERVVENLPHQTSKHGSSRLWEAVADAVDRADPEDGLRTWVTKFDDPAAQKALAMEGFERARDTTNWTDFFYLVDAMEPSTRAEVRQAVQSHVSHLSLAPADREAWRRRGMEDWLADPTPY